MYERTSDVVFSHGASTDICKKFIEYKQGMGQKYPRSNQYNLLNVCKILNNLKVSSQKLYSKLHFAVTSLEYV